MTPEQWGSLNDSNDRLDSQSKRRIHLARDNGKFYYVTLNGDRLNSDSYDWASEYHDGVAWVRKDGLEELLDESGNSLTSLPIVEHWPFENKFSRVRTLDGKFHFIGLDGKAITTVAFDQALDFYKERAIVRIGSKRYVLTTDGRLIEWNG